MDEMNRKCSSDALKYISRTLKMARLSKGAKKDAPEKDLEQEQGMNPPEDVPPKKR